MDTNSESISAEIHFHRPLVPQHHVDCAIDPKLIGPTANLQVIKGHTCEAWKIIFFTHLLRIYLRLTLRVSFKTSMSSDMSSNNSHDHVPALTPPLGVTPNLVNPYSLSAAFVVTAILCLLLATSALLVRLAISFRGSNERIWFEAYTCALSWLGLVATCILNAREIQEGLGRHQWNVPESNMKHLLKLYYINRIFYSPTILAAKLTILLQLMRIFAPIKRGLVYWLIQALIWLNAGFYLANVLSVIFQCTPVRKAWNPSMPGVCVDTNLNLVVTGAINVLSDALILLLPLWTIWHLKMPTQRKLGVSVVFAAGIFANFAGIMRFSLSIQIIHGFDLTFLRLQHGMWTIAEITTAICCASLPLIPRFVQLSHRKASASVPSTSLMLAACPPARDTVEAV